MCFIASPLAPLSCEEKVTRGMVMRLSIHSVLVHIGSGFDCILVSVMTQVQRSVSVAFLELIIGAL